LIVTRSIPTTTRGIRTTTLKITHITKLIAFKKEGDSKKGEDINT